MATTKGPQVDTLLPVMAAAMLGQDDNNSDLKSLIGELLQDYSDKRRKEREKEIRLRESAVQSAKEEEQIRASQQNRCAHRKQNDETRLAGQYLSGTGQLSLVCTFCQKNYFLPPIGNQVAPPRELIPNADAIGS